MACTANFLLEVEDKDIMSSTSSRTFAIVPHRFIQTRPGFEANGVEVQLHVDVRMHAPKGWNSDHENKIREILCRGPSAKIYTLKIYPLYGIRDKDNLVWISVEDSDSDKEQPYDAESWLAQFLYT